MGMVGWGPCAVWFISSALFSGAIFDWFSPGLMGSGWISQAGQLVLGSIVMGIVVSALGNLLVDRHAIRWGVIMPLIVMITGSLLALFCGSQGALLLFLGIPVLAGLAVAAGLVTSFIFDGISAPALR